MNMFIIQNNKLYVKNKDGLIGISVYSDKVLKIKGTESKLTAPYDILTAIEVKFKFNITENTPYIFPKVVKKEVVEDEPIVDVKRTTKKSTRK